MRSLAFIDVANSSRSQMAEGLAKELLGPDFNVTSAGSRLSPLDPRAVDSMAEIGIDISSQRPQLVEHIDASDLNLVVTLSAEVSLPLEGGDVKRLHWSIPDPASSDDLLTKDEVRERFRATRDQLRARIEVLNGLFGLPESPLGNEFHGSIRVQNLASSVRFYAWLLGTWPKEWTHRYATFVQPELKLNFVLLESGDMDLHHDTLYHLGIGVANRDAVISAYHNAIALGVHVEKPPRTTWKGTPLHELWLKDPDGTLIEIYARLTAVEMATKPVDEVPQYLVSGTGN